MRSNLLQWMNGDCQVEVRDTMSANKHSMFRDQGIIDYSLKAEDLQDNLMERVRVSYSNPRVRSHSRHDLNQAIKPLLAFISSS